MANPSDLPGDISEALDRQVAPPPRSAELEQMRRVEALTMVLAGFSYDLIADRLKISERGARDLVNRTLNEAENRNVDQQRALENERLDRAQMSIWTKVLAGDVRAVEAFLKISARRAKLNNLDAPLKVDISMNVRHEMETALQQLENIVKGEVVRSEIEPLGDARDA